MYYRVTRAGIDEPNVETLDEFQTGNQEVPSEVMASFDALLQFLSELGFVEPTWYVFEDGVNGGVGYQVVVRHQTGAALARLWKQARHDPGQEESPIAVSFLSALDDGVFVVSTASNSELTAAPGIMRNAVPGADAEQLWLAHRRHITADATKHVVPMPSAQAAAAILAEYHRSVSEAYLEQGIFQTARPGRDATGTNRAELTGASTYAPVLQQIEELEERRSSWASTIVVLGISFLLFFVAGAAFWSWETLLVLIPVLLFHECGHYIAMRVFGYRNVRMFFIPLFGAAVSGRHYNVPGWKKAMVSLAGPVPGIVLGIVLGAVAVAIDRPWLMSASLMLLLLNGFNLLPFVPFDGGWVAHAILFCRHPVLDVGFRVIAALVLIAGGWALGTRLLPMIGILMLLGTPIAFRTAQVAVKMRKRGLAADPEGARIPREAACQIIDELKPVMAEKVTAKQMAQTTLRVYEDANTQPPSLLATIGIGVAYVVSFLLACVALFVLMVVQEMVSGGSANVRSIAPRQSVVSTAMLSMESPGSKPPSGRSRNTVIAAFATRDKAKRTFAAVVQRHPVHSRAMLVGQTIFLDLPPGDERARKSSVRRLRLHWAGTTVAREPFDVPFTLECVAPTEQIAGQVEAAIQAFNDDPESSAAHAPWAPQARPAGGTGEPEAERYSARMRVHRTGRRLVFEPLAFNSPYDGFVALLKWLEGRGCAEFYFGVGGE